MPLHPLCFLGFISNLYVTDEKQPFRLAGHAIDYLHQLESRLKFRCKSIYIHNTTDVSFTKLILEKEKCSNQHPSADPQICICQLGIGGWFMTKQRHGKVIFLPPFASGEFRMLVHRDDTFGSGRGLFFLSAFSPIIWLNIFVIFLLFTFLTMLVPRFQPGPSHKVELPPNASMFIRLKNFLLRNEHLRRLRYAAKSALDNLIYQPGNQSLMIGNSTRHWILQFVIMLSGLFILLVFESSMTALLVQENVSSEF